MTELLVRAEGLDVDEVSDGYVIYQTGSDRVHYLNKTAAIVFELCDGARGTDDIVSRVSSMFELGGAADGEIEACIHSAQGGAGPIPFEVIARTWSRRVRMRTSETKLCFKGSGILNAIRRLR